MLDASGREVVTVKRDELLAELRKNRDAHREVFDKAIAGWEAKVLEELTQAVKDAKAKRFFNGTIVIPRPKDQTADYDRVIKMVEMSVGDTVTMSKTDFACYVMDDWSWKQNFTASTAAYLQ